MLPESLSGGAPQAHTPATKRQIIPIPALLNLPAIIRKRCLTGFELVALALEYRKAGRSGDLLVAVLVQRGQLQSVAARPDALEGE